MFVSYLLHVSIVGCFTLRQKRIRGGSTFAEGNRRPPALAQTTIVSVPRMDGPYTIPSAARQHCIHTRCPLSWTAGGTQPGSEGQGRIQGEWSVRGTKGARSEREGGSDDVRHRRAGV